MVTNELPICPSCGDDLHQDNEYKNCYYCNLCKNRFVEVDGSFSLCTFIEFPNKRMIPEGHFKNRENIRHVVVTNHIRFINDEAFKDCVALTTIELPKELSTIGKDAFSGCVKLKSISIPNGATSIGAGAFEY